MENIIKGFPEQLKVGLGLGSQIKLDKKYDSVVVSGMGGSIIAGDILLTLISHINKDKKPTIFINREYGLPDWVGVDDLVVCISWKGTTEETISSFRVAAGKGLKTIVISKGGEVDEIEKLAQDNGSPLIRLPDEKIPPRFAVGYMTGAIIGLMGLGDELNFDITAEDVEQLSIEGESIAGNIGKKIPLIYSSFEWRKLPSFWKILFNENAKIPAFWNYFPGLAHNEIASLENGNKSFYPIMIVDELEKGAIKSNFDAAIAIFNKLGYNCSIVNLSAGSKLLEKILKNYILALWTSFYLAKKIGVDPEETRLIDEFKEFKK